jgi:hypothetical protein
MTAGGSSMPTPGAVKESVQRYCLKQLDRKMRDRDFEDIWVAVLRSMQTRGEKFSQDSLAVDAVMLVKAYDHAALNPLLAIYLSEAPLLVQHGDKASSRSGHRSTRTTTTVTAMPQTRARRRMTSAQQRVEANESRRHRHTVKQGPGAHGACSNPIHPEKL